MFIAANFADLRWFRTHDPRELARSVVNFFNLKNQVKKSEPNTYFFKYSAIDLPACRPSMAQWSAVSTPRSKFPAAKTPLIEE